jgi:hypothetical protein
MNISSNGETIYLDGIASVEATNADDALHFVDSINTYIASLQKRIDQMERVKKLDSILDSVETTPAEPVTVPPAPMLDLMPVSVIEMESWKIFQDAFNNSSPPPPETPKTSQKRDYGTAQVRWNKNGDFSAKYYDVVGTALSIHSSSLFYLIDTGYGIVYRAAERLNFKDTAAESKVA